MRENRSLKRGPISMSDSLCLKLLVLNSVGYSYSPWHDCPSPVFFAGTNMRTICVVTVGINMANMVAIATLNDICGQKWIAQRLLDRETSIIFLSFWGKRFFFLFARGFILIFSQSNAKIIPWHNCPSTGAVMGAVSVSTVRIYVTYIASSAALVDAWGQK